MANTISLNTIGLKKISAGNYEVTPCKFKYEGFSITVGEGIKRAFSKIDLEYKRPCYEYIQRFFALEMLNIFHMPNDPTGNLIRAINRYCTRTHYHSDIAVRLNISLHDLMIKDILICNTFNFFHPFLDRISLNGTRNLPEWILLNLFRSIHGTTLLFIDNLLKQTGSKIEIARELYLQESTDVKEELTAIEAEEPGYLLIAVNKQYFPLLCLIVLCWAIYSYY